MRYGWTTALLIFAVSLAAIAGSRQPAKPQQQENQLPAAQQTAAIDQRGTEAIPLAVRIIPAPKSDAEVAQENAESENRHSTERWGIALAIGTLVIAFAQTLVFCLQLRAFNMQARRLKETIKKMDDVAMAQAADMAKAVAESARAAAAMEGVAESMKANMATTREIADRQKETGELQLRAYVTAIIGTAFYQDRKNGIKFEGKVRIINTGHTPAKKVFHNTQAAILPVPLPKDYVLPQFAIEVAGENTVGPHQDRTLSSVVSAYVDDAAVSDIKKGIGSGLYVWGYVSYEDVFGRERKTTFCHLLVWQGDSIMGYYIPNRNSAT